MVNDRGSNAGRRAAARGSDREVNVGEVDRVRRAARGRCNDSSTSEGIPNSSLLPRRMDRARRRNRDAGLANDSNARNVTDDARRRTRKVERLVRREDVTDLSNNLRSDRQYDADYYVNVTRRLSYR